MPDNILKERRRFPRYGCSFSVCYSTRGMASFGNHAIVENVSKVGLCVRISRLVKQGNVIKLIIHTENEYNTIRALGMVRWVKEDSPTPSLMVRAGIEFLEIDPFDVDKLLSIAS